MTHQWQPGDVALYDGMVGLVVREDQTDDRLTLVYADQDGDMCSVWVPSNARPLVVIDPEDRNQVGRLIRLWGQQFDSWTPEPTGTNCDRMQAALRELANPTPPKPDEPTGMWSVVADKVDDQWVRVLGPDFIDGWVRAGDLPNNGKWTAYADIAVVRVLSEGIR